jgi:hypothetical protein
VDKSDFFKWIKCFSYWLFSAQLFAELPALTGSRASRTTAFAFCNSNSYSMICRLGSLPPRQAL